MSTTNGKQSNLTSLVLVGFLYAIFGFFTWLNNSLIPFLKTACQLTDFQAYLVTTASYISYFVMAVPSSFILNKTGFKKGMSLGLLVMAVGCIIFIPAANRRDYSIFLLGLFVQGLGLAILQTAVNPYVTILGPEESAARRISIMGMANKAAGILSPAILGAILLKGLDMLNKQLTQTKDSRLKTQMLNDLSERIIDPYIVLAIVLVIFSLLMLISPLPNLKDEVENPEELERGERSKISAHPYLFLGAIAIFLYVGVEVIAGDTINLYGNSYGIDMDKAKYFGSITLICMVIGYAIGTFLIPKFISQETALKYCAIIGIILTIGVLVTSGITSVIMVATLGLAHSLMWPAIFPMSLKGLGRHTKRGAAFLIMGIAGGAILPPLYGQIADMSSRQAAYAIMIPCYLYILFFAVKGHLIGYKDNKHVSIDKS
jgi:FHS family L-fucose permease-like MFS transporter